MKLNVHENDIPDYVLKDIKSVAIDTEAMGLNIISRDRLCVLQMFIDKKYLHIVKFPEKKYNCPNLKKLLKDNNIQKIFHYARFDMLAIYVYFKIMVKNVVCTKILSKIARTYSDRHGLKEICRERLKIDLNKGEQSSDWGSVDLSQSQINYASKDVLYLEDLYNSLKITAIREGKFHIAQGMFKCLPAIVKAEFYHYDPVILISHH